MIRPTLPDGTPLTIREQLERAAGKKAKRAEKRQDLPWGLRVANTLEESGKLLGSLRYTKPTTKKRPKPRKPKSLSNSKLEAIYWDAFSFFIRLRDKRANAGLCFYCEKRPIECAMHRIKRGKRATKYDERNVDGGCHWCNDKDRFWPQEFDAIFIRKKGAEVFLALEELSRTESKRSRVDILEKTALYREKARTLLA